MREEYQDEKAQARVHEQVRQAYTRAVSSPGGGCCGSTSGNPDAADRGTTPRQKGSVARAAGYAPSELETLPRDAVENSFGCGNPLSLSLASRGDTVLDLGSGAGIDLILAARRVGRNGRVIGVDMTDEMISHARRNAREAGHGNIEVRKGTIENLPVEDDSVDLVISNCVINLSPDKPRVFSELARVLKPGGRMSVADIVVRELPEEIRRHEVFHSACVAGAIGEEEYLAGLAAAGLAEARVADRMVYDATQLRGLVKSEEAREVLSLMDEQIDDLVDSMAGRVWSARFEATKPLP